MRYTPYRFNVRDEASDKSGAGLKASAPDCLVVDIHMPDLTGLGVRWRSALRLEDVDRARERIGPHRLTHRGCQTFGTFAKSTGFIATKAALMLHTLSAESKGLS
jgi:hypothetical protein